MTGSPLQPSQHRRRPLQHPALGVCAEHPAKEPVVGELPQQGGELHATRLGKRTQPIRESLTKRLRIVVAGRAHLAEAAVPAGPREPAKASR